MWLMLKPYIQNDLVKKHRIINKLIIIVHSVFFCDKVFMLFRPSLWAIKSLYSEEDWTLGRSS